MGVYRVRVIRGFEHIYPEVVAPNQEAAQLKVEQEEHWEPRSTKQWVRYEVEEAVEEA